MDQPRPQGFRTNMRGQRPATESISARSPTAVRNGPPGQPAQTVPPGPGPLQPDSALDGEKAGATLLFSGVVLTLVGVTLTAMGWRYYQNNPRFEWTQLLGPILISVGGTFVLTSVCKFNMISCNFCRQWEEEALVVPVLEQNARGHCFMISGINQPNMPHDVTTMLCTPPAYNFIAQEVHQAIDVHSGSPVSGFHAALPPRDAVYCVDNGAFTSEGGSSARSSDAQHRRNRIEKTQDGGGSGDRSGFTCSRPPAYEDLYPSSDKHNPS